MRPPYPRDWKVLADKEVAVKLCCGRRLGREDAGEGGAIGINQIDLQHREKQGQRQTCWLQRDVEEQNVCLLYTSS